MSDDDLETEYQSLSKTAVVAMVVAVLGLLGAMVPLLAVISVFAAILAVVALLQISRSDDALTGSGMAKLALVLSLAVIGNALGYHFTKSSRMVAEGRAKATQFFQHLADGERKIAHQLMKPVSRRVPRGADLDTHYQQSSGASPPKLELEGAFTDADTKRLTDYLEAGVKPQFKRSLGTQSRGNDYMVDLEYTMPKDGAEFMVTMRREYRPQSATTHWNFVKVRWKSNE